MNRKDGSKILSGSEGSQISEISQISKILPKAGLPQAEPPKAGLTKEGSKVSKISEISKIPPQVGPKSRSGGFTLLEMLTVVAIMSILTSAIFWMILFAKTTVQASQTRAANRQDLHLVCEMIAHELEASSIVLSTAISTPQAICFPSAFDSNNYFVTDSNAAPVWQKYVVYYVPTGTTRLLRREVTGAFTFTSPPTSAQVAGFCNGQGSLIAPSVSSFALTPAPVNASTAVSVICRGMNLNGRFDDQQIMLMTIYTNN